MINIIHSFYFRVFNKIKKINKKKSWKKIPHVDDTVFFNEDFQLFDPHLIGTKTLGNFSTSNETIKEVSKLLDDLDPEPCINFVKQFISKGLETYGHSWKYADINTVLFSIGKNLDVKNYLEIGVRRGRSMCVLSSQSNNVDIYGFDMWIPNYTGVDNPGKEFVKSELNKVGHRGNITFIDGDSKKTVPEFFKNNPDLFFDVITVDGDHSLKGATVDLKNVIKKLKVGGILVFDDISSHEHPYLFKVWKKVIMSRKDFYTWEFSDVGLGVAFAIKKY